MKHSISLALSTLAAAAALLTGALVTAQANIDKLRQMKVSGTDANIPTVAQTGKNADQLRDNLKRVKGPEGFKIDFMPSCRMPARWPWRRPRTCCS